MNEYAREFGKHVRSLRRARGVTQDVLAQRSGVSADTIRRIEHGNFSASIDTLRKLCSGLGLQPSTLFESFELGRNDEQRELLDLISSRTPKELTMLARVVRVLLDELDGLDDDDGDDDGDDDDYGSRGHERADEQADELDGGKVKRLFKVISEGPVGPA